MSVINTDTDYSTPPSSIVLQRPYKQYGNDCYDMRRAYEMGYTDGRYYPVSGRRPGAKRGVDANYDAGFAMGLLDRIEIDGLSVIGRNDPLRDEFYGLD